MKDVLESYLPAGLLRAMGASYHFLFAFFGAVRYGFPSRKIRVIGVTGTKGKTTTAELIRAVLVAGGHRVASASSVYFRIGDETRVNDLKMTMPGRFFLQKFLQEAARAGCRYAVIEVTSQGIIQFRHRFIRFHAAVMTNVTPEHVEAHGGFEQYLRAKLDLFWRLPRQASAIVNCDDALHVRFLAATAARRMVYSRGGIIRGDREWRIQNLEVGSEGISFDCGAQHFSSSLIGAFNASNIIAAVTLGLSEHIALPLLAEGISRVSGVPGRMEFVQREPFGVVVDYAHTPESLRTAYEALGLAPRNRDTKLICVLGAAGGGRDTWKRPVMGSIAAEYCTTTFITNEDPYDENPEDIIGAVMLGFLSSAGAGGVLDERGHRVKKIVDRKRAIIAAIAQARAGDTVIITGKGSERWIMGPQGTKIPWDDCAVAREALGRAAKPPETI